MIQVIVEFGIFYHRKSLTGLNYETGAVQVTLLCTCILIFLSFCTFYPDS